MEKARKDARFEKVAKIVEEQSLFRKQGENRE